MYNTIDCIKHPVNRPAIEEIIRRGGLSSFVPWVGSGISSSYGFPTWSTWITQLLDEFIHPKDREGYEKLFDSGRYLDLLELFCKNHHMFELEDRIRAQFFIRDGVAKGGVLSIFPEVWRDKLVTTNYDRLIEDIYSQKHVDIISYTPRDFDTYISDISTSVKKTVLLKLHGDVELPETYVATKSQYEKLYSERGRKNIASIFITNPFIYMGSSFTGDKPSEIFEKNIADSFPSHRSIIFVPLSSWSDDIYYKKKSLDKFRIWPLFYLVNDHNHSSLLDTLFYFHKHLSDTSTVRGGSPGNNVSGKTAHPIYTGLTLTDKLTGKQTSYEEIIKLDNITECWFNLIIGSPRSGKTTLLKTIYSQSKVAAEYINIAISQIRSTEVLVDYVNSLKSNIKLIVIDNFDEIYRHQRNIDIAELYEVAEHLEEKNIPVFISMRSSNYSTMLLDPRLPYYGYNSNLHVYEINDIKIDDTFLNWLNKYFGKEIEKKISTIKELNKTNAGLVFSVLRGSWNISRDMSATMQQITYFFGQINLISNKTQTSTTEIYYKLLNIAINEITGSDEYNQTNLSADEIFYLTEEEILIDEFNIWFTNELYRDAIIAKHIHYNIVTNKNYLAQFKHFYFSRDLCFLVANMLDSESISHDKLITIYIKFERQDRFRLLFILELMCNQDKNMWTTLYNIENDLRSAQKIAIVLLRLGYEQAYDNFLEDLKEEKKWDREYLRLIEVVPVEHKTVQRSFFPYLNPEIQIKLLEVYQQVPYARRYLASHLTGIEWFDNASTRKVFLSSLIDVRTSEREKLYIIQALVGQVGMDDLPFVINAKNNTKNQSLKREYDYLIASIYSSEAK